MIKIETALKSYVLETMVASTHSDSFNDAYTMLLDNYKMFSTTGKTFKTDKDREKTIRRITCRTGRNRETN